MKDIWFVTITLMMTMVSCNMPFRDIAQEQGEEGEEIRLFHGDTEFWVRTGNPNLYRLCRGRFFHFHPNDDTVFTWFITELNSTIISGHINESVMDSIFLLADRKPLDSIFGPLQTLPCPFDSSSTTFGRPREPHTTLKEKEQIIKDSSCHDFWILNMKTSDVYGPYTFDDYLTKKNELGVPATLKLKYETQKNSGEEKRKDAIQEDDFWGVIHRCLELVMKFIRK